MTDDLDEISDTVQVFFRPYENKPMDHDLQSIQQARTLVQRAHVAKERYKTFTQDQVDGIVEAMNADQSEYENRRAIDLLKRSRRLSLEDSVSALIEDVDQWRDGQPREDDISLVSLESM